MRLRKISIVLLALLLAAMAMVPMVSAGDAANADTVNFNNPDISKTTIQHQIPDDYLKNSKPMEWLPESEMINIIISQRTLERYGQKSNSEIIEIPVDYVKSKTIIMKTEKIPGFNIEEGISPDESVVLIRMPAQLFDTYISEDVDGKLSFPMVYFCRFYSNLNDLSTHITKVNGSIEISPSSQYPVAGLSDYERSPITSDNSLLRNEKLSSVSGIDDSTVMLTVPQEYKQWARSWRSDLTNYKYCIGQIRPYRWSLSGTGVDLFKIFTEREYKFNNGEALEIVAQFFDRNEGAGIVLYPALYRNGAQFPISNNDWSYWNGYLVINPNDIPHAYGYHVQTTNSGSGYQVNFEDMNTLQWVKYYTVAAASPVSSFTELDGSSEYRQLNVPSTDTFAARTSPIIDEWAIDVNDNWYKPAAAWDTPVLDPATAQPYVSVDAYWDGNGNLITRSFANYP
jgi:hypothetical protein